MTNGTINEFTDKIFLKSTRAPNQSQELTGEEGEKPTKYLP